MQSWWFVSSKYFAAQSNKRQQLDFTEDDTEHTALLGTQGKL